MNTTIVSYNDFIVWFSVILFHCVTYIIVRWLENLSLRYECVCETSTDVGTKHISRLTCGKKIFLKSWSFSSRLVHRDFYAFGLMLSITWMNSTARIRICLVQSLQTEGVSSILVSQSLSSLTAMTLAAGCSLTTWLHSRTPAGLFLSLQAGHGDSSPKLVGILVVFVG